MLKKLRENCDVKRAVAKRIAKVMGNKRLERIIHVMWFDILEQVLDETGYSIDEVPGYYAPTLNLCYRWEENDLEKAIMSISCVSMEIPYQALLKAKGAYLTSGDEVVWACGIKRDDIELTVSLNAKIPQEDIDLLTEIGVRRLNSEFDYPEPPRPDSYYYSCSI